MSSIVTDSTLPLTPETTTASLMVRGLGKSFGKQEVLRNLDWQVASGKVIGLLGRNGAGKTTLLRCLLGLTPSHSGTVEILGQPMDEPRGERLHRIGYVPQSFDLFPWMKVGAYLTFTAAFYPHWSQDLVNRLLQEWQLGSSKKIAALSQGQRQMLAIIRALAPDPDLLLLDEPVASLDPIARRDFLATLLPLVRRPGKTVIFSTHITTDLERVDADIALLREGRITFTRPLRELREQLQKVGLTRNTGSFDAAPDLPGALAARVESGVAWYVFDRSHPQTLPTLQALAERENAEVSMQAMSLEDLFVELA